MDIRCTRATDQQVRQQSIPHTFDSWGYATCYLHTSQVSTTIHSQHSCVQEAHSPCVPTKRSRQSRYQQIAIGLHLAYCQHLVHMSSVTRSAQRKSFNTARISSTLTTWLAADQSSCYSLQEAHGSLAGCSDSHTAFRIPQVIPDLHLQHQRQSLFQSSSR